MDEANKELSSMFYNYLCDVIGSERVVHTRRAILASLDTNISKYGTLSSVFTSGSRAEGLDLKGSDIDMMVIMKPASVYENYDDIGYEKCYEMMIMDTSDTKPGFTKMIPYNFCRPNLLQKSMNGTFYFSSRLFREDFCKTYKVPDSYREKFGENPDDLSFYTHGPCATVLAVDVEYDVAMSLHCSKWVSQAKHWIARLQYSWATDEVIQQIINFGVLFVPVGIKKSPTEEIEWRISYSHAEKLLIWSLNHTQFLCYALMKIMLNDVIKKRHGDLICSYFIKTIIFWICEETDIVKWRADNILSCFMSCLKRLIYCVKNKTCLHYFIPENNFFENRFSVEDQRSLLLTLDEQFRLGWGCLLNTETLKTFRSFSEPLVSSEVLSVSFTGFLCFLEMFTNISETLVAEMIYRIVQIKNVKDINILRLSCIYQRYAEINLRKVTTTQINKERYNLYRKGVCHSLLGVNHDAVSGWILLASFFYTNKQYQSFEHVLIYCLCKRADKKCLVDYHVNTEDQHRFNMIQSRLHLSMLTACKIFTVWSVKLFDELRWYFKSDYADPSDILQFLSSALISIHSGI